MNLQQIGQALGEAVTSVGDYSANAAARANAISQQAQSAQGAFNQASANQANMLNQNSINQQYGYNSAMMSIANDYNQNAWDQAAAWNERMWEKQRDFNAEQAEISRRFSADEAQKLRDWQMQMDATKYQRAVNDMSAAGLNPILAVTGGGISAGVPSGAMGSGSTAQVGGAQMSSAQAQMASGGLLGANSASESNYTGQMENLSTWLATLGAVLGGISTATEAMGSMGDFGKGLAEELSALINPKDEKGFNTENVKKGWNEYKEGVEESGGFWNVLKDTFNVNQNGEIIKDRWGVTKKTDKQTYNQYNRYKDQQNSWNRYSKPKG